MGYYDELQNGDNEATMSNEAQIDIVVDSILEMLAQIEADLPPLDQ
jgi:hypothetical protein